MDGEVVAGAGRGKGLGYPTANLRTWPRLLLPGQGIYAGVAELQDGSRYLAAIDVGTNPTFGTEPLHVEAFLLDFADDELRGDTLTVEFWERLRDEVKFDSVDELVAAIADDVERTRSVVTLPRSGRRSRAGVDQESEREPGHEHDGIVTLARWSKPFPGRTTSRRKIAESPTLAPAAPSAGFARSRSTGSRASAGASATNPSVPAPPPMHGGRGRARRSPTIDPPARRAAGSSIAGRGGTRRPRSWRGPRPRSARARARPAGRAAAPATMRTRPCIAPSAEEPRRHHLRIRGVAGREPADVLVPHLVLVLPPLCQQPGGGEGRRARGRHADAPRRPDPRPSRHRRGCNDARMRRLADRLLRWIARAATAGWFRAVDVTGLERIPRTGPVLLVASHHGGFVDPALLVATIPRPIRFVAMGSLFRNLRRCGAPLARRQPSRSIGRRMPTGNGAGRPGTWTRSRPASTISARAGRSASSPRGRRATSHTSSRSEPVRRGSRSGHTHVERWVSGSSRSG